MILGQQLNNQRIFIRLAKALISLRVSTGWSEPLVVTHTTLLEISCHGSIICNWASIIEFGTVAFASRDGSGEPAQMRRLARVFIARVQKYRKTKTDVNPH